MRGRVITHVEHLVSVSVRVGMRGRVITHVEHLVSISVRVRVGMRGRVRVRVRVGMRGRVRVRVRVGMRGRVRVRVGIRVRDTVRLGSANPHPNPNHVEHRPLLVRQLALTLALTTLSTAPSSSVS